jgi:hypothetical protein
MGEDKALVGIPSSIPPSTFPLSVVVILHFASKIESLCSGRRSDWRAGSYEGYESNRIDFFMSLFDVRLGAGSGV